MRKLSLLIVLGVSALMLEGFMGQARADGFIVLEPVPLPPILPPRRPTPMPRPHMPPVPPTQFDTPLAVRNHQVTCDIVDGVAVTRVDQTFYNPNPRQVEGTYIFPLDDDIALKKFSMFVDGKEIQGQVLERDEARRTYEAIVHTRRDPALLEYVGTRMYKARIFPIPPHGDVRVKLEYSQILDVQAGLVRYRYPLGTEKFSSAPLEQVSVVVGIESKTPIKSVFCPTHTMAVRRDSDHKASASFEGRGLRPDQDLLLYYTLSDKDFGLALLSYRAAAQDGFFLARIAPKALLDAAEVMPKDICFVVDTSGSMAGEKIEQARKALNYCLSSLNRADRFCLVSFSHEPTIFGSGMQEATPENVTAARAFVDQIKAEGGTNINDALAKALQARPAQGDSVRPYLIVFLTDGQPTVGVTDPAGILANVKQANAGGVRLFVFGIGDDVNAKLLDRLAEDNHGARDYVGNREDLEIKLSGFYRKVADPVLANLQLTWQGLEVYDVFPRQLPDLFSGGEVLVVGRYRGSGPKAIELRGDRRGTRERHVYEETFAESDTRHEFLPQLWASRKVGFLLDEIRLHGENKELVDAVARLAIEYGIVTPYTAYLVNEQQQQVAQRGEEIHVLTRMLERAEQDAASVGGRGRVQLGVGFTETRAKASGPTAVSDSAEAGALQGGSLRDQSVAAPANEVLVLDDLARKDESGQITRTVQQVSTQTFYNDNGVWIDATYQAGMETRKVKAYSDEYYALAARDRRAARVMAQGPRVIFMLDGTAYETVVEE